MTTAYDLYMTRKSGQPDGNPAPTAYDTYMQRKQAASTVETPRISGDYNKLFGTASNPNPLQTDTATANKMMATAKNPPRFQLKPAPAPVGIGGRIMNGLDTFNAYSHAIQDPLVNSLTLGGSNLANKAGNYLGDKVGQLMGATPAEIAAGHQRQAQYDTQQQQLVPQATRNVLGTVGNVAGSIGAFGGLATRVGQPLAKLAGKAGLGKLGQAMVSNGATMGAYEGINSLTQGNGLAESAKKAGQGVVLGAVAGPAGEYLGNGIKSLVPGAVGHYAGNALGGAATGLGFSYGGNMLNGQSLNNTEAGKNAAALAALSTVTGGKYREPVSPLKMSDINRAYGPENPNRITMSRPELTPLPTTGAKQPWQMTKNEFENNYVLHGAGKDNSRLIDAEGKITKGYYTYGNRPDIANMFTANNSLGISPDGNVYYSDSPIKGNWEITHDAVQVSPNNPLEISGKVPGGLDPHKYIVEQALAEGKPVPPKVLADYPGLKKPEFATKVNIPEPTPQANTGANGGAENTGTNAPTNQFVKTDPIQLQKLANDKTTTQSMRDIYTGRKNEQVVIGNQLADQMKKLAPTEQEAIHLYLDAGGDMKHLQSMAKDPNGLLDKPIPNNTKITYRQAYQQALNLSPKAQEAANLAKQYYAEGGNFSKSLGTIGEVKDNYTNRMWQKEPKTDFVKTEMSRKGLSTYTSHSKQRVFNTVGEGLLAGKTPETLSAADNLSIHNEEMARVNTNKLFTNAMTEQGLGGWVSSNNIKPGWAKTGLEKNVPITGPDGNPALMHQVHVAPEGIAKGLAAVTQGNFIKQIEPLANIQKFQGYVKTVDLAISTFHHIAMAAQTLYETKGGIDILRKIPQIADSIKSGAMKEAEQDFVKHTGMTAKVESNQDILRKLTQQPGVLGTISRLPINKQFLQVTEKSGEFLFGKMQRYLKVLDYQNKLAEWATKNPGATPEVLAGAKTAIAKHVNGVYGGLNWGSLGVTPSMQSVYRIALLAPDWTMSNFRVLLPNAFKGGLKGSLAREHYLTALITSAVFTEGLNYVFTNHFTDRNEKGHELEIEVQPGVYISAFRGAIGDISKWAVNMHERGLVEGTAQSLQGKLSPFLRTALGAFSNRDPSGKPIYKQGDTFLQKTVGGAEFLAKSMLPLPFGVDSTVRYVQNGDTTLPGLGLVATGAGRFSPLKQNPKSPFYNEAKSYEGNWLRHFTAPPAEKSNIDLLNNMKDFRTANDKQVKLGEDALGTALTHKDLKQAGSIVQQYKLTPAQAQATFNKIQSTNYSPLAASFNSMNAQQKLEFWNKLSPADQQRLQNELTKAKSPAK